MVRVSDFVEFIPAIADSDCRLTRWKSVGFELPGSQANLRFLDCAGLFRRLLWCSRREKCLFIRKRG